MLLRQMLRAAVRATADHAVRLHDRTDVDAILAILALAAAEVVGLANAFAVSGRE